MKPKNTYFKKVAIITSIVAMGFGFTGVTTLAAPPADVSKDVNITIEAGDLTFTAPSITNFANVKLSDQSQEVATGFDAPLVVSDSRGSGEGWNLRVSATVFKTTIDAADYTLPTGKLKLTKPTALTSKYTGNSVGLNNLISGAEVVIDGGGAVPVASASLNNGKGQTDIVFATANALKLTIDPSEVKVDQTAKSSTYTATLTWALTEAP